MLPSEALNKFAIKDIQSVSIKNMTTGETVMHFDYPYDKNDNLTDTIIKQSINTYVRRIVNDGISDTSILKGVVEDGYHDNYIDQQRVYKFSTNDSNRKFAIAIPIPHSFSPHIRNTFGEIMVNAERYNIPTFKSRMQEEEYKQNNYKIITDYIKFQQKCEEGMSQLRNKPIPPFPIPLDNVIIHERFELPKVLNNILPKCKFCGKRHFFWMNGYKNNIDETCLCKKCCVSYGITGSKQYKENRFYAIEKIRQHVKDHVKDDFPSSKLINFEEDGE
jgi:hypothetical protein